MVCRWRVLVALPSIGQDGFPEDYRMPTHDSTKSPDPGLVIAAAARPGQGTITARKAGGLRDMALPVSPKDVPLAKALQNLAKAINIAFSTDFLENELEQVYKAARVRKGAVEILHADFIGLGDGVMASIG